MGLLAIGLLITGVLTLRLVWGKRLRAQRLWLGFAWGLIMFGHIAFANALGAEIGIPAAQLSCMLFGLLLVLGNRQRKPRQVPRQRSAVAGTPVASSVCRKSLRFLLAGPLAAVAAISVGMLLTRLLQPPALNAIVIAGLSVPLLWACAVLWAIGVQRLRWPLVGLLSCSGLSLGLLLTGVGGNG
ncbi:hypothetical protein ACRSLK_15305 [Halopseudomonas pachastrellae]|uniref:hypothetical protein n=1 Tax=Halopseudomonas pachastrellae TaxID=254161 RepID=UPI003D7E1366